jgi:hypothetical protein
MASAFVLFFFHRAVTAFRAASERCVGVMRAARFTPPMRPASTHDKPQRAQHGLVD